MQTLKFIAFLFLVVTKISGQTNSDVETENVFKSFIKDKREVFLRPTIDSYYIKQLSENLSGTFFYRKILYSETGKAISDTLNLTKIERFHIDSSINSLFTFEWTDFEKDKCGLDNFNLIKIDQREKPPEFNHIVYSIARPIFIKNNSICFLFYEYNCGSLCGHGELMILTKKDNKWVKWKTILYSNS